MRLFDRTRPPRGLPARLRRAEAWAFDWDGTLLDSMGRTRDIYRQLFAEFAVPFDERRFRAAYSPDWRQLYQRMGLGAERWPQADRRWMELYEAEDPPLVAGVGEALRQLASAGTRLALVTAGHRARVELELRAAGLEGVFTTAVYGDAVPHQKPDPAPLQLAARYLRLEPSRIVFVGDARDDMTMARRAGALAVGVLTGADEARELKRAGARWVAPTVREVVAARDA
jgi:HAD superfamily hydrolase (TIGR01509 family)